MIKFSSKSLPFSERIYIAFRIAFLETQERLALAEQLELESHRTFGYLTHVPFLKGVPAQVQLDLLLDLWDKHLSKETFSATYLDEAIVYAVCETAANLIRSEPKHAQRCIESGPLKSGATINHAFAEELQQLHLDYAGDGHYLLLSQFQDLPPEAANKHKDQYGIIAEKADSLFDALSRWNVRPGYEERACGLLTDEEVEQLSSMIDFTRLAGKMKNGS
ncbi:hypothetical protein [Thalassoglobus sp.]|uniref:hypothetical protein n=1 Tax=Thalassoglobus sp. TaxID=2795869 RepID=UPI003AA9576A